MSLPSFVGGPRFPGYSYKFVEASSSIAAAEYSTHFNLCDEEVRLVCRAWLFSFFCGMVCSLGGRVANTISCTWGHFFLLILYKMSMLAAFGIPFVLQKKQHAWCRQREKVLTGRRDCWHGTLWRPKWWEAGWHKVHQHAVSCIVKASAVPKCLLAFGLI